jgi:hypothetical protein
MQEGAEALTLESMHQGAAVEMWQRALAQVLANINDINTSSKARKLTLLTKFQPSEDRSLIEITLEVKTELAGQDSVKFAADLSLDEKGRPVAFNRKSRQLKLTFKNVSKLNGGDADD